jgi:hypothetical protein
VHSSLTPRFNLTLMGAYAAVLVCTLLWNWRFCVASVIAGTPLGLTLGLLQRKAIASSTPLLRMTNTAMDVRRALRSTKTGKVYILVLWISFALLLGVSILASRTSPLLPYLSGLAAMWFVREAVTLPQAYSLSAHVV